MTVAVLTVMALAMPGRAAAAPRLAWSSPVRSTTPTTKPSTSKPVVTFGIQPSSADAPDGRGYFDFTATPGARLQDHVAVTNYSTSTLLTLTLKATDASNTAEGDFALLPPNSPAPELGAWVVLPANETTLVVAPRKTVIVPFELRLPQNASPGDHIGGIEATLASSVESPSGQRLKLLQSVGTRLFVRVSGPLHPKLSVTDMTVAFTGTPNPLGKGRVTLTYRVKNTGNVALGGDQTAWVSGLFGGKVKGPKLPTVQLLLPGYSVSEKVSFPAVFPQIEMGAHVSITPLVVPGSQQPPSGPYRGSSAFLAVPWTLIAIVAGIILILVFLNIWFRRRQARTRSAASPRPSTPEPRKVLVSSNNPRQWSKQL